MLTRASQERIDPRLPGERSRANKQNSIGLFKETSKEGRE